MIAAGKEQLSPFAGRTITIANTSTYYSGSLFFALDDFQESEIVRALGLNFEQGFENGDPQSMEQVNQLADVAILLSYDRDENQQISEESPLFQSLPVAPNGQYTTIFTRASRALFAPGTLSVRWVIPYLVEMLSAASGNGRKVGS